MMARPNKGGTVYTTGQTCSPILTLTHSRACSSGLEMVFFSLTGEP